MISPPMYSWYPSDVLMVSLRCTHGIPPMYWTPPPMYSWYPSDVLMVNPRCTHGIPPMYSWYPPDILMVSPRCTHGIPPMYSWIPPMYWTAPMYRTSPDVLNTHYTGWFRTWYITSWVSHRPGFHTIVESCGTNDWIIAKRWTRGYAS